MRAQDANSGCHLQHCPRGPPEQGLWPCLHKDGGAADPVAPALPDHIVPLGKHSPVRGGGLGLEETCTRSAPTPTRAGAEVDRGPASGALGRACLGLEQWVLAPPVPMAGLRTPGTDPV